MPPLSLMIKPVSSACNMRCAYCFYSDVSARRAHANYGRIEPDALEILVRRAFAYADEHITFAFQGGEPTLAGAAFYEELIALQRKYNTRGLRVQNSLQTNGLEIDDRLLDLFASERFLIGVSLDGTRDLHDRMRMDARGGPTYDRVTRSIERMAERGIDVNILCVVNGYVARDAARAFNALSKYGYIQFIPCLDDFDGTEREYSLTARDYADFLIETFRLYARAIEENRYVSVRNFDNYLGMLMGQAPENCAMQGQCGIYYLIEGDLSVYPCDFYVLDPHRMGNAREDSFIKLAKSPVQQAFRAVSYTPHENCRACRYRAICRGGCRRDREPIVDGELSLNRFCAAYERFFDASYDKMIELTKKIRKGF